MKSDDTVDERSRAGFDDAKRVAPKILAVCSLDVMAWKLLLPWLRALLAAGYEVHIACARSNWFEQLAAAGFHMHHVPFRRRINPLVHVVPFWKLYRLIRRERFELLNAHSPVAAAVGRVAAWLARCPVLIYTVHGFYFHDDMHWLKRRGFIALEWLLGKITNSFMFVSDEDRQTALRERIASNGAEATTIYNGVNLEAYSPYQAAAPGSRSSAAEELRAQLKIPGTATVVGIVGRVVREKGYMEFAEMAKRVATDERAVYFLVVGDALPSDRDGIAAKFRRFVETAGLTDKFRFTGFTDRVADYLQAMDIFVLPSYREGFPRSVLEAMSSGLPVIATNIRGCREAIVKGETGLIVPPRDGGALSEAVSHLLENPERARRMGVSGRERAVRLYDERMVQGRFVKVVDNALKKSKAPAQGIRGGLQRVAEMVLSAGALVALAPVLGAIAVCIRVRMGGGALFVQRRVGLGERVFPLYKFRTMTEARGPNGKLLSDEQRLTPLGRILRSTSLDELPQLWNVVKGDMSLIGPRPLLCEYLPRYTALQRRRHEVRPGITGWVQISGRNGLTWEEKFDLDVWYVDHKSIRLDAKILWLTIWQVLRRDGISQAGHATMPEFVGSRGSWRQDG